MGPGIARGFSFWGRVVGGKLFKDRHTTEMMPEVGNDNNATVERDSFLQCMSPLMALSDGLSQGD